MRGPVATLLAVSCSGVATAAILAPSAGCDPGFHVCVTVQQCFTETPVVGAHVSFFYGTGDPMGPSGDTDSSGRYCGGDIGSTTPPPHYAIHVEETGYQDQSVEVNGGGSDTDVCMTAQACAPGEVWSCNCGNGGAGSHVCNAQGTGFDDCAGCPDSGDAGVE